MLLKPFISLMAGALSQGYAARQSADAARQQRQLLHDQVNADTGNYFAALHDTGMQGRQAQSQLALVRRAAEKQNGTNTNAAIAGNLTREQVLAGNQQTANSVADAVNRIASQQTSARLQLRQQHQRNQAAFSSTQQKLKQQEAQNWANLGHNLASALIAYNG